MEKHQSGQSPKYDVFNMMYFSKQFEAFACEERRTNHSAIMQPSPQVKKSDITGGDSHYFESSSDILRLDHMAEQAIEPPAVPAF